ncbi:MAG: enoyl-CoA hydratase [Candidatus Eremiobacteraeota bacterium]|nr:enoyl-CoA hydratase [Candidatus Eremiobacteraeota bacterium]
MSDDVEIERIERRLELRLNRPAKKNALTGAMYGALADALAEGEADANVRAFLLCGAGETFTSGHDIGGFAEMATLGADAPVIRLLRAISRLKKPLVAAVNGPAIGIGVTMLLHCDLAVAVERATFRMPFVDLGLVPEAASSLLVPRLVGRVRAAAMLLLGEEFDARAAHDYGIVNRLAPDPATALEFARDYARRLCEKPPGALAATKALLSDGTSAVAARIEEEAAVFVERLASPEAQEAFAAFLARRPADFSRF